MAIRSKSVNARDKAFTNAYNNAKQRNDLDFYNGMMEYSSRYGYQDLFVQKYNAMDETQRQKIQDLLYNIDDEYKAQTAFQEMTVDILDNVEKKKFKVVKYDENDNPVLNEKGDGYIEEEREMTEQEHARYILDHLYKSSKKKMGYDYTLKQQQNYKDNLEWYHKAVNNITGAMLRFDYGVQESLTGLVDFIGSIGYGFGVWIGTGRDGYREYYQKHSLAKDLAEGEGSELVEFERLYTDYRDVLTGDYTTVGKYLLGAVQTVGNMFPYMLIPGGAGAGAGAKVVNTAKSLSYYAGMFGTSQSATINDPDFANVSTLSIIFNGAIKTAAEMAIEKFLSKALGRVTGLDKRLGTNTSKGMTKFVDKTISKGGKLAKFGENRFSKFLTNSGKVLGKYVKDAMHEGVEEGLQELSGMLIDRMFDSKGETFFKEGWNFQNVLDAMVIGAIVSGSMSTVEFMTTKRVSTGNMEEIIDKKTGEKKLVEKKLTKSESIIYNAQIENLYNAYEQLMENSKKSGDADTGAFWAAQAYQSYSVIMEYFKGIGEERATSALKLLSEINSSQEKMKTVMSAVYVKTLIDNIGNASAANKIMTSSPEFINKMKDAKITTATVINKDAIENLSPEWRKVLQERWKEHPDFTLVSTDGTNIVVNEDSSIIMVPEAWFKEGALDVFKSVSEREVVNELHKELLLNEKELLEMIHKEYIQWSGETDASVDKALYSLLYDNRYYSTFMYAHWTNDTVWQIFSRLNDVAKSILSESNIKNSLTKLTIKKIERNMKKTLLDISKSCHVDYSSVTVFTKAEKEEIRLSDTKNRGQLIKDVGKLKQELELDLDKVKDLKVNAKLSNGEVKSLISDIYNILSNNDSSRIEVMDAMMALYLLTPSMFKNNNYYISLYSGSGKSTLPKEIVDILTTESAIHVSKESKGIKQKDDILSLINSITYEDGTPRYNANYGIDNDLYVYQNINIKELLNEKISNTPLVYLKQLYGKNKTVSLSDIIDLSKISQYSYTKLQQRDLLKLFNEVTIDFVVEDDSNEAKGTYNKNDKVLNIEVSPSIYSYLNNELSSKPVYTSQVDSMMNTLYHEVNHAFRSLSYDEGNALASDLAAKLNIYNDKLNWYIDKFYPMSLETMRLRGDISRADLLYFMSEMEMNAFNIKNVIFSSTETKPKVFTSYGFVFGYDHIITPSMHEISLDDKMIKGLETMSHNQERTMKRLLDKNMMTTDNIASKYGLKQESKSKIEVSSTSSYMKTLASNQKNAKVENTYDMEFRNEVYQGVKDLIKSSVPKIYRETARINDIISDPDKYLTDDVKQSISDTYGKLDRNSMMKYMQKYFYDKYKKSVDITFKDGKKLEVVFVNIKNFSEYESGILSTAKYDGVNNGLTNMVEDYEMTLPNGKKKKGVMPVSMFVKKEHNFGLISRAVVKISDTEGPHYDKGVITLRRPKNNNDFRYQFAHEFQHLLDEANGLSGGTSSKFQVTADMIKQLNEHVPGYIPPKADIETQIRMTRDYVYHRSGERKAYGITWFDADFVHVERTSKGHIAHMPWGAKWTLAPDATQEGRSSIVLHPERKSVPIGRARQHWLMRNYLKSDKVSIAQTESLTNFIFDLTEENFKKLDEDVQDALMSYAMTSQQLYEYIRTTDKMNQFTFDMINKHFFGNTYFTSFEQIDEFLKDLSVWHALYMLFKDDSRYEKLIGESIDSNKIHKLIESIKKDRQMFTKFEKHREDFYKYNDAIDDTNSIRTSAWFNMRGRLIDALKIVAWQATTTKKIHSRGESDTNAIMLGRQKRGQATLNTRETFKETVARKNDMMSALAEISNETKAQFIANVYSNPAMYEMMLNADISELNAQFVNAIKRNGGLTLKQDMKDFTSEDMSIYDPTIESYQEALNLLGKRLWRATTKNPSLRKSLGYKFNSETKSVDFDFKSMEENGTLTLENLEEMREEVAYNLRIAENVLISRKGGAQKVRYEGLVNVYKKDTSMPSTIKQMIDKTAHADLGYTNVQGTDTVEYAKKSYKSFLSDNEGMLMDMINTPGEVERVIEYISSDPPLYLSSEERQRYQAYTIMVLAWIKNMHLEHGLTLDNYHLELLDKVYNMIGHEWGTTGAALRVAVNLVSPTAYMLQELSKIDGVKLEENDIKSLVKAMRSGDAERISEEMAKLEKLIYERGGDNKMSVLDMFFSIRSAFMLSSPGTWARNISSNVILRGGMRAASAVGTTLAELIFRKTKGVEEKYGLWKIQGTQPTIEAKEYTKGVFDSPIYQLVKDGLNKYQYDEDRGAYKKDKEGSTKLNENAEPVMNMNNNMYAYTIVNTIKKRFFGATTFEKSMGANKVLKHVKFLGKMMDKANALLGKVLSDEKYIKARATYYFERMLTEAVARGDIKSEDLQLVLDSKTGKKQAVLNDKIATILGQAFTEACADYMHKGSFLKDFENILYKKYRSATSSTSKLAYGAGYSLWKLLLPYANAGWNWFREGIKYSPAGILSGVIKLINLEKDINNNPNDKMIAFRAKQDLGKGVIGMTIMGIAIALAKAGVLGYDDEEDVILVGDYTLDVTSLFGSPAFVTGVIIGCDEQHGFVEKLEASASVMLDGFFLVDFIDSLSYTSGGWQGFLNNSTENLIQSMIPNLWKQVVRMTQDGKYKYSKGIDGMWDRFFASLIPDWADKNLERKIDPYTGEYINKWDIPFWSKFSSWTFLKVGKREMSDIEKYSLEHGVPKSASDASWDDKESGKWSYDYDEFNRYRGELNKVRVTEFMNDVVAYEIERNGKTVKLKASQMTDEEIKVVLERIYTQNARYSKIWAWTQLGNKYYATPDMYITLKKLGINNIYHKDKKHSGFVKSEK